MSAGVLAAAPDDRSSPIAAASALEPALDLRRLGRSQAVALAVTQGPEIAAAFPLLGEVKAGEQIAGEFPNPVVGASLGPDDPTLFGTLEQRLPIFGQRGAAIRAAQVETQVALAELEQRQAQVHVAAQRAYTALALAEAEQQLAGEAERTAAELAARIRAKVSDRLAPELEAQLAELGAARASQEVRNRGAELVDRQAALARVLGLPTDAEVATSEPLAAPEAPASPAAAPPVLRAAELSLAAARARVEREQAALRPDPTVGLQFERLPPPNGPNGGAGFGLRGGFTVDLPVLSQNGGAISRERQAVTLAEATLRQVSGRLAAGRRAATARFTAAAERARFNAEVLVPGARRVAEMAASAYELGRTPLVTLLQARADWNSARAGAVEAAAQAWDAREDLEEVVGAFP